MTMTMIVTTTLKCDHRGCERKCVANTADDVRHLGRQEGWQVSALYSRTERELMDLCPDHRALPEPAEETRKTCVYCGQPLNNGACQRSHP